MKNEGFQVYEFLQVSVILLLFAINFCVLPPTSRSNAQGGGGYSTNVRMMAREDTRE